MREFFKPWRRKIGAVTLVMACLFAAAWVRSLHSSEAFHIKTGRLSWICFCLDRTLICGIAFDNWQPVPSMWLPLPHRSVDDFIGAMLEQETYHGAFGFGTGLAVGNKGGQFRVLILPCRPLAIILTLLSAYLLLTKPRPAKPTQIIKP